MAGTLELLPFDDRKPQDTSPFVPPVIRLASSSPRRAEALRVLLPDSRVLIEDGGDEEDTDDVPSIARGKVEYARRRTLLSQPQDTEYRFELHARREELTTRLAAPIIAADTRTSVRILPHAGSEVPAAFTSLGKPGSASAMLELFRGIDMHHREHPGWGMFYVVDAACAVYQPATAELTTSNRLMWVELEPEHMHHLATPEGLAEYIGENERFQRRDPFTAHPTQVSGGLALEPLLRGGYVKAVNGERVGSNRFEGEVRRALFTSRVSFSFGLLASFDRDPQRLLGEIPSLNTAINYALGKK